MPHPPTVSSAESAIRRGQVDHGEWSAPNEADREQDECLGTGRKYPIMKDGKVSKHALANAEARATSSGHPEIANHARRLLKIIDEKTMAAADDQVHLTGVYLACDSAYKEALTVGQGLPTKRNGKPVHYYWKEALRPGTFVDSRGTTWNFKPADIDAIVSEHDRAMRLASHEPGLDERHPTRENPSRGKNYGWVVGAKKNARGRLELLHQFVGDDETNEALNKKSSILLVPGKKDHLGNTYKWWIEQNAIVSNAQLRDLDPEFKPALAASGELIDAAYLSLSEEQQETPPAGIPPEKVEHPMDLTPLRAALGEKAKDKPDADVLALSASEHAAAKAKLADLELQLSNQTEANTVLAGELQSTEQARDNALALSQDNATDEMDPQVLALSGRLMESTITNALLTGDLCEKQAAWLRDACKQSRTLMLSADPATGFTEVDRYIGFAKLGAGDKGRIVPNQPIKRMIAKPIPAPPTTELSLAGAEDNEPEQMSLERRNELRDYAGLPPLAALHA